MRSSSTVRAVALFEAAKGALVLLAGFGSLSLIDHDAQRLAEQLVGHLHLNPAKHYPRIFIDTAAHLTDAHLWLVATLAAVYGLVRFVEAYGLWRGRRWAEWFAAVSGGIYIPYPIFAQVEGKRARTGIVLAASGAPVSGLAPEAEENAPPVNLSFERHLEAVTPLAPRAPDVTHRVILAGAMAPYAWSLNGEYWPNVTPLMITRGQRVAIEMLNHSMMAHPMHLHGHAFQVVAINGAQLAGAVRDTVLVPPMGSVTIAFDADNPGRWAFHCHNLYHMMTGMMTEVRYPSII